MVLDFTLLAAAFSIYIFSLPFSVQMTFSNLLYMELVGSDYLYALFKC